jgi:hypothetical protein
MVPMITHTFDNGWGNQYGWKKTEIKIVNQLLYKCIHDHSRTVVINSVWYTGDFHQQVMSWLRSNDWDRIVLVAMLDPAIPRPEWYTEFDRPVVPVGYYPGKNEIDLCALLLADSIDLAAYSDLLDGSDMDTPFICLNRKPHWHRRRLFARLQQRNLLDRGVVSMGSEDGQALRSLLESDRHGNLAPNSTAQCYGVPNDIASLGPPEIWRRCFFNLVTETVWDINSTGFVSEKIYKPILGMRPFVVYDPDGGETWLRDRGFETYRQDFRDISSHDPGDPESIMNFLTDLVKQPRSYYSSKFWSIREKLRFNHDRYYRYVQEQRDRIAHGVRT